MCGISDQDVIAFDFKGCVPSQTTLIQRAVDDIPADSRERVSACAWALNRGIAEFD